MLNPEQANQMLEGFRAEGWEAQRRSRVARLPGKLSEIGWAVLACARSGKPIQDWRSRERALVQAAKQLDELSQGNRLKIFEALFPEISICVERAWLLQTRLPYLSGWTRKAFRAPNTPRTTQQARGGWLRRLIPAVEGYQHDVVWFAAWAPYLRGGIAQDALGILFAAAIDTGDEQGDAVFDTLLASARGEHEIGAMGRHVPRALLVASRLDGWAFIEKLLLAAQRQEGLRQVILETVDEAHPEAFRRMLSLIQEHDLARFSAVVRAVDVWFGFQWESGHKRDVDEILAHTARFLEDPDARADALDGDDSQATYLALWTMAFEDAIAAVEPAARLLDDPDVERRFVGTHLLTQLGLVSSQKALLPALEDQDLRIVTSALNSVQQGDRETFQETDLFERLERIIHRFPRKKKTLEPIVWPWTALPVEQQMVASALSAHLGDRSPKRLLPYLTMLDPWGRESVVDMLAETRKWDAEIRDTLFSLVGDRSQGVRERAIKAIARCAATEEETRYLESLLTRKAGDLRRGVLSLLLNMKDQQALASAQRLLEASHALQRVAGLELLRQLQDAKRVPDQCRAYAKQYREERSRITDTEENLLGIILGRQRKVATLNDALGLLDPAQRTRPVPLRAKRKRLFAKQTSLITKAAVACLDSLDDLVHDHRTTPVTIVRWDGSESEELLGNLQYSFPSPRPNVPFKEDVARLPLQDVWETWWAQRPKTLRDGDGLELLRALAASANAPGYHYGDSAQAPLWLQEALIAFQASARTKQPRYSRIVVAVLTWLVRIHPPQGAADFLLDAVELTFTLIPSKELARVPDGQTHDRGWRSNYRLLGWLHLAREHRTLCPTSWDDAHHVRLWHLLRWMDEPGPQVPRHRPRLAEVLAAFRAGEATEADLLDQLLGPRVTPRYGWGSGFDDLRRLTGRKPSAIFEEYPILQELITRCRKRIIEIELDRGDMPTAASKPALALRFSGGLDTLVRLLQSFGREKFIRGWTYDNLSKASVFSHLIRTSFPSESDTPDDFAVQVEAARIPHKRLIELAVYAPQWSSHVERTLEWPGAAEAVWWIHAHTKDSNWRVDQEIREAWTAQVSERTPLSGQDLLDGAVDVAWFLRTYKELGQKRWDNIHAQAKYAAGGGGHKRAQLFADAMLGQIEKEELLALIADKRRQDSVRALGLLPLAAGDEREGDLLERYQIVQEFVRTGRKFGSQRQTSEKLAARIGLENLARTAGFPDPVRLQWAMEAREIEDLAEGPVTVTAGETTVSLAINDWGEPILTVTKNGKRLKSVPAKLRKEPQIAELRNRKRDIKRQASRMRSSLEQAMCRGDTFTGAELRELFAHPVLAPMIERLVFVSDGVTGYPSERGYALRFHDGTALAVGDNDLLRIAHPHDLLATKEWHLWQRESFLAERVQPFKQVFRELYVLTETEKAEGTISRRYAGHQVQPRQALALLGQRGWVSSPEEGVRRTFHGHDLSAWVTFLGTVFTPAEVEGLTIEGVTFAKRGEWKPLELVQIPPRVFSEVMRDLDLVVSVAHQGEVDPEASASTVEMRTALARETCAMLGVANVRLQGSHALIEGQLGSYSVHLGSAVVHRQPGGAICIIPVHAQHRGRLFLPFADDDPKTAEVLSKILLLARDTEIKDPTILEQILPAH